MLDLSSGRRQLPFFALAGRYYISEAPLSLSLSVLFYSSHFSLPLFSLSHYQLERLCCFGTVLPLGVLCLSTLSTFIFFFFIYFLLFFFLPGTTASSFGCSPCVSYPPGRSSSLVSDSPLSPLSYFPRPRGVKLCAQTPVS